MTIRQFIQKHRQQIDAIVQEYYGETPSNDKARLQWILNDRGLYEWVQQEGINI